MKEKSSRETSKFRFLGTVESLNNIDDTLKEVNSKNINALGIVSKGYVDNNIIIKANKKNGKEYNVIIRDNSKVFSPVVEAELNTFITTKRYRKKLSSTLQKAINNVNISGKAVRVIEYQEEHSNKLLISSNVKDVVQQDQLNYIVEGGTVAQMPKAKMITRLRPKPKTHK